MLERAVGAYVGKEGLRRFHLSNDQDPDTRPSALKDILARIALLDRELGRCEAEAKADRRAIGIAAGRGIQPETRASAEDTDVPAVTDEAPENQWLTYWNIHTTDPAKARKFYLANRTELDESPSPFTSTKQRGEFFRKLENERTK